MPNAVIPVPPGQQVDSQLQVAATRPRQTERPPRPFHDVLAGGVSLLLSGAEVATHVVAGPMMAAAVHDARVGATGALGGSGTGSGSGSATSGDVQSLVNDGQASNLQLLALQQQIQNDSQQFSTLSNVMRARFDTAKAAVSNIRA
ncbi:MAG TPA: hypothetical protein VHM31_21250 [Polyangia bacterium]|nr:hypothetical protein [Polyangia bacterium]